MKLSAPGSQTGVDDLLNVHKSNQSTSSYTTEGILPTTADKADDLFTSYSAGLADRTTLKHGFCAGLKPSKIIRDDVTK